MNNDIHIEQQKTSEAIEDINRLKQVITCIRQYRSAFKLSPGKRLSVFIQNPTDIDKRIVTHLQPQLCFVGRLNSISFDIPKSDQITQEFEALEIKLLIVKD